MLNGYIKGVLESNRNKSGKEREAGKLKTGNLEEEGRMSSNMGIVMKKGEKKRIEWHGRNGKWLRPKEKLLIMINQEEVPT